jgi:DNA-binding MarR family transcriptional regulator
MSAATARTQPRLRTTTRAPAENPRAPRRSAAAAAAREEAAARVLRSFRIVFNAVKTHFREVEKKAGLAGAQLWALSVIRDQPGAGVNDLARAMDVHQSTASNLVRTLLERELVVARRNGPDRRTVQLHVLPAGARLLRRAPGPLTGVLPAAVASLDRQTLARLEKDLATVIAVLHLDKRSGRIPLGQP